MKTVKNVMFTGDSVTDCGRARPIGDGFGAMGDGYVARIFVDTWAEYPEHSIHYFNSAVSGNTSKQLLDRFDEEVLSYQPDYLFLMIGINDVWRHFDGQKFNTVLISPEETKENVEKMIKKALAKGAKPILLSPYFIDSNREMPMRKMTDQINLYFKELCKTYEIPYIDIQKYMDEYIKQGSPYILSGDRVHPSAVGKSIIAKAIYTSPVFAEILHD